MGGLGAEVYSAVNSFSPLPILMKMIYLTVDEIPEDRYLEMLLAGDEDEDMEEFINDDDDDDDCEDDF